MSASNADAAHAEMKRMVPALMRFHVRSSANGEVLFSFLCVCPMQNAGFSDDSQNRLNDGAAVRLRRLVSHLVSGSLSLFTIITTALALVNGDWGLGHQQANVQK